VMGDRPHGDRVVRIIGKGGCGIPIGA